MRTMRNFILLASLIGLMLTSCENKEVDDPVISTFEATPTSLPKRDTVRFTIDAAGDYITLYDGKAVLDISTEEMPYKHVVGRIRFRVTPPADTIWAKLSVTNVYDTDNIKTKTDSIEIILLDQ